MNNPINILLVDDDSITNFITSKALQSYLSNVAISVASNGQDALDKLQSLLTKPEALPDIIFLDINMPVMDGWDFLNELQKLNKPILNKINIYLYTSSLYIEDKKKADTCASVKEIISKPFTKEQVLGIVRNCGFE